MAHGIKLKDEATGAVISTLRNSATSARTYTLPDRNISIAGTDDINTTFSVLSNGSAVTWNCNSNKLPFAKLISTQSFTLTMTNVLDASNGTFKLITNTASAITVTFDVGFTNKTLNTTFTTYTFPALTAQEYFLSFVVDGTTIEWVIGVTTASVVNPWARVSRIATQAIVSSAVDAIIFDTESTDNANIYTSGSPTRLTIPGSGNKIATINACISFVVNATGLRRCILYKNGSSVTNQGFGTTFNPNAGTTTEVNVTFQAECVGGDYFEIIPNQTSGGNLNATAFATVKIEDR
jgi:hypothetical protein